jgi:hypothetical protein
MAARRLLSVAVAGILCLAWSIPTGALARPAHAHGARRAVDTRALLRSHELWATINVCDPTDRPDTVGVRGSMPGDGQVHDRMFMAFRLQYLNTTTKAWVDLAKATSPSWVPVGAGASARQGGFSFTLKPMQTKTAVTLRGVVDFQWRNGKTVRQSAARPSTSAHKSVTGADPAGFSAATCAIG